VEEGAAGTKGSRSGWSGVTRRRGGPVEVDDDSVEARPLNQIPTKELERIRIRPTEFSRVLGGGLVPGSLTLLGGPPGVGKSTLLTMLLADMAAGGDRVVYLSAEESGAQVRARAERLGKLDERFEILEEPALERILPPLYERPPQLLVVDSIQTVYCRELDNAPGSVTQIRSAGAVLADYARVSGCAVILAGHVTKEGDLAGPRVLEHLVDTVLYFEPDAGGALRLLRAFKNRFGSTGELAVLEMSSKGLLPVDDASALFLHDRRAGEPGSAVSCVYTGTRPILVEVQALLADSSYATPARVVAGVDNKRIALLNAILQQHVRLNTAGQDVYVKVAGGLRVQDPGADLAFVAAMASSHTQRPLPGDLLLLGEVGLTGDLRPVSQLLVRLNEAAAHGFRRAVVGSSERGVTEIPKGFELESASSLREALRAAFRGTKKKEAQGEAL
jgi:DNA repair protein RadA/Sms